MPGKDYSALDDDQLNRLIAQLLGWTNLERSRLGGDLWGNAPDDGRLTIVDDWAADSDASLALFADLPHHLTPRLVRMLEPRGDHMAVIWKAVILNPDKKAVEVSMEHEQPSRAIDFAWLFWKLNFASPTT